MKKSLKNILILVLVMMIVCSQASIVCAQGSTLPTLNPHVKGKLKVILKCKDNNEKEFCIEGKAIEICQVADLEIEGRNAEYKLKHNFKGANVTLNDMSASQSNAAAKKLLKEKEKQAIDGFVENTNDIGESSFENLEQGMYLVMHSEDKDKEKHHKVDETKSSKGKGNVKMEAFLVSVPEESNGEWKYYVEAVPKVIAFNKGENPSPPPQGPDEPVEPENPFVPSNPENPDAPQQPEDAGKTDEDKNIIEIIVDAVRTGDAAELDFWIAIAGISILAAVCLLLIEYRRRKHGS